MHPLEYFEVGKTYKRTRYDEKTDRTSVSYVHVKNEDYAKQYHDMQSHNDSFELNQPKAKAWRDDPFESDEPVIRIHKLDMDTGCESCSA